MITVNVYYIIRLSKLTTFGIGLHLQKVFGQNGNTAFMCVLQHFCSVGSALCTYSISEDDITLFFVGLIWLWADVLSLSITIAALRFSLHNWMNSVTSGSS